MPIVPGTFAAPKPVKRQSLEAPVSDTEGPNRHGSIIVSDDILVEEFARLCAEEHGIPTEAMEAYEEVRWIPFDQLDAPNKDEDTSGVVQRRAPKNPLRSPLMGKFRKDKKDGKDKVKDPALEKNPLRGRLLWTAMSSAALLLVFLQALTLNKAQTGRFHAPRARNGMLGPEPQIILDLGGLNTNEIRKGDTYRLFWSMWMHSGWLHIGFNIVCQLQFLWMLEPDWGFIRTFVLFFVSGFTGNLFSAICDPCSTTVGSSGALFGLMGAMFPYCIEYWKSIPRPGLIVLFSLLVLIISILTGFTGTTDNWAHMGGMIGGVLFGLATITTLTACEDFDCQLLNPFNWRRSSSQSALSSPREHDRIVGPDGKQRKKVVKRNPVARVFQKKVRPGCKCGIREWVVRGISFTLLAITWGLLLHFLFSAYDYQPPGHVTYSNIRACCCCNTPVGDTKDVAWTCNYCDAKLTGGGTWQSKCKKRADLESAQFRLGAALDKLENSSPQSVQSSGNATLLATPYLLNNLLGHSFLSEDLRARLQPVVGNLNNSTISSSNSTMSELLAAATDFEQASRVAHSPELPSSENTWRGYAVGMDDQLFENWENLWHLWEDKRAEL